MTGMRFIGPHPRAVTMRAAANRLRWEVDAVLGVVPGSSGRTRDQLAAEGCLGEIAETLAILRHTLDTIDASLPPQWVPEARERLRVDLARCYVHHEVPR